MSFLDLNSDIKPWLGIDILNTTHDAVLTVINNAMDKAVLNYVETDFQLHTEVNEVHDGNLSDQILPRNIPIVSVEALYFYCDTDGLNGTLIDPDYYAVLEEAIVLRGHRTPFSRARVRIDYTWGYDGLPGDVKLALLQAVEAEFRRKGNKTLGIGSRSKKDESESFKDGIGDWDEKTGLPKVLVYKLTSYKRFEFPIQPMSQRNW